MRLTAIKWATIVKYWPYFLGLCIAALIISTFFLKKIDGFVVTAADKAKEAIQNGLSPTVAPAPSPAVAPAPSPSVVPAPSPAVVPAPSPAVAPTPSLKPNPLTTTVKEVGVPLIFSPSKPNAVTATVKEVDTPIVYLPPKQSCPTLSPVAAAAAAAADARVAADTANAKVAAEAASKVIAKNILNLDSNSNGLARNTRYGCNLYDEEDSDKSNPLDNVSGTGPDCACQDSMPARADSYSRSGKRSGYRFNPEMDE